MGKKEGGAMMQGVKAALAGAGAPTILKNKNKSKVKLPGDRPEGSPSPTVFPKKKKTTKGAVTDKELKFKGVPSYYGKEPIRRKVKKPRRALSEGGMNLSPKADLDGDGMFSKYERARGEAIQKAMAENKKVEGGIVRGGGQAIKGIKFKGVM